MAQYEAFDEAVEVQGETILAVVDGALARFSADYRTRGRELLAENGVRDPDPDEWYPQQAWLDTFESIADELEPHLLDRLGEQIPTVVAWPDAPSSVEAGLRSIDEAYRRNHRGGEIGHYGFEPVDERIGEVTCRNPYPCAFDRGLVRAVARRYAPVESFVYLEERDGRCRRDGADACAYTVHW